MTPKRDRSNRHSVTRSAVGYVDQADATRQTYEDLGFRCGLETHQQLKTDKKLFCRCPAGHYQMGRSYDAQLVRHMRPTLSELGEYDGTALMEFKTRKNILYRIKSETACTYDIDDTPPFPMNRDALEIAMEVALLLGTNLVGEIHITRKQYLDGSIPTGFQRTAIVGIEGAIQLAAKRVGIIQLSIEEDSCREVSDIGHDRVYSTDRLGTPLIETVTYPELLTPDEAREAADVIRFVARSTGKVNTGIGAARQDVNVSIAGGTRIEIKGVQHIRWIPALVHNEAFRQKALLKIREDIKQRIGDTGQWTLDWAELEPSTIRVDIPPDEGAAHSRGAQRPVSERRLVAVNLPGFAGILGHFTQPTREFADEISERLKVIACLEQPNMTHSESTSGWVDDKDWEKLAGLLNAGEDDVQLLFWGSAEDLPTAVETIEERCRLAFSGVPNETRKALPDGTTIFERVLPGPNRMYPDTDSAPIPIPEQQVRKVQESLPTPLPEQISRMDAWGIPTDACRYILRRGLFGTLVALIDNLGVPPKQAGSLLGHTVRHVCGARHVDGTRLVEALRHARACGLAVDLFPTIVRKVSA
ncbi:Glu-tRNA(Gln) amidotransferase subunit GatE, partial [Candidatus Bipolaricaulota bacterium]|nr:Glu-tRNA(Gln) amidotransferase subunit GatE [Candidatus Bipolaricaulota bacterium]